MQPLTLSTYPRAILHIDGDAFFASCEQARDPHLKGRPVITGKERGIVASMSYEAKALGITRGMRLFEAKKVCPDIVLLPSNYEMYSLLSKRFFAIVRRYTPEVEEYSIDECFADLTGLRRILRGSYPKIAERIKNELDTALGFTFSIGLGPNKVLAKIGSKWNKPSGLTAIPGREIHVYLEQLPVEKVWGIGKNTTAFLAKHRKYTALDFARTPEAWVRKHVTKPLYEIWQELNGRPVLTLETQEKSSYASIQKVKTFTPPSEDMTFVFAQLAKNIENACMKARRYELEARGVHIFLRSSLFRDRGAKIKFSQPTAFPHDVLQIVRPIFEELYESGIAYRATGVTLLKLVALANAQMELFRPWETKEKSRKLYDSMDSLRQRYGKHTVFLGASLPAHQFSQHLGERGDIPTRQQQLIKGETKRRRLGLPAFEGKVE